MTENKKPIEFEINEVVKEEFERFLSLVPIKRLSHNIRNLLLSYLKNEIKDGIENDFQQLIQDLSLLFELFDLMEGEYDQSELLDV